MQVIWGQGGQAARDKSHAQRAAQLRRWVSCKGPTVIGCWRDRSIFHETRRRPIPVFTARLFWPPAAVAGFYTNLTGGPCRACLSQPAADSRIERVRKLKRFGDYPTVPIPEADNDDSAGVRSSSVTGFYTHLSDGSLISCI